MSGVFGLTSAADLLKKLQWEFDQFIADPTHAYLGYNFFVTAWHLLEWKYPGTRGSGESKIRQKIRDDEPLLQICEHLAVGAKHFDHLTERHQSVLQSEFEGLWAKDFWAEGFWAGLLGRAAHR